MQDATTDRLFLLFFSFSCLFLLVLYLFLQMLAEVSVPILACTPQFCVSHGVGHAGSEHFSSFLTCIFQYAFWSLCQRTSQTHRLLITSLSGKWPSSWCDHQRWLCLAQVCFALFFFLPSQDKWDGYANGWVQDCGPRLGDHNLRLLLGTAMWKSQDQRSRGQVPASTLFPGVHRWPLGQHHGGGDPHEIQEAQNYDQHLPVQLGDFGLALSLHSSILDSLR